nr:12325_t:CDS:2 [Entrophospora candida]
MKNILKFEDKLDFGSGIFDLIDYFENTLGCVIGLRYFEGVEDVNIPIFLPEIPMLNIASKLGSPNFCHSSSESTELIMIAGAISEFDGDENGSYLKDEDYFTLYLLK